MIVKFLSQLLILQLIIFDLDQYGCVPLEGKRNKHLAYKVEQSELRLNFKLM